MPPQLDLSLASKYPKRVLSSRLSPSMKLRHVPLYSGEKGPLSSTSSRFNFNHLVHSPPQSPSLPALIPRHGKLPPSHPPRRYIRVLFWVAGVLTIMYFGFSHIRLGHSVPKVGWSTYDDQEYEMVGEDKLPDFPTPVVVTDKRGRAKWTVSIPSSYDFPLQPEEYAEICRQNKEASSHVADLHKHKHVEYVAHYDYYHVDPYFMDVAEAEKHGMLADVAGSKSWGKTKHGKAGSFVGISKDDLAKNDICKKSMTFVMETTDAGFGRTLMLLWMAYGLAQKEERAFFVDDSRWAYGRYANFFKPPPIPDCLPPPRHEMLPCPHHARHLIVSDATRRWTFGGQFNEAFEDPRKMEVFRQKPIYQLARVGYESLFHLADSDSSYVEDRAKDLRSRKIHQPRQKHDGLIIGAHVRHGDRHPMDFQYRESYIPLVTYTDRARDIIQKTFNASGPNGREDMMAEMKSIMVLASDDPEVYESDDFSHAVRAQEKIGLASKKSLPTRVAEPVGNPLFKRFIEENIGWEGGFFAAMFWSLGRSTAPSAADPPKSTLPPTDEALRLRELVGRAYLMDLAVLGAVSDVVICTVSSMGCKLLAVMMGWESAIEKKAWVNIDGEFEWRAVAW